MKAAVKIKIYLLFFLLLFQLMAFSQEKNNSAEDHEFSLFLLLLLTVFVCGMFGAAVAGSMIVTLGALAIFALIGVGIVSTSVAMGIYKRSLSAGLKTFLLISFGLIYGLTGAVLASILQYNFFVAPTQTVAISCGFIGGVLSGIALTFISMRAIRYLIGQATERLKLKI